MSESQKRLGLIALVAFAIWYFFFRTAAAVDANAQSGYIPPNDPTRMATDPTLNNGGPNCTSGGAKYGSPLAPQIFRGVTRQMRPV